jgi:hypothetical protein
MICRFCSAPANTNSARTPSAFLPQASGHYRGIDQMILWLADPPAQPSVVAGVLNLRR